MRRFRPALLALPTLILAAEAPAQVTDRIARNVEQRIEDRIVQIADDAVTCVLTDRACIERVESDGQPVVLTDENGAILTDEAGNPVSDPDEAARQTEEAGSETWRNYDFVPGTRVIKVARMDGEPVGRFPSSQLEYVRGTMQVSRVDGVDWLESSSTSVVRLLLPGLESQPDRPGRGGPPRRWPPSSSASPRGSVSRERWGRAPCSSRPSSATRLPTSPSRRSAAIRRAGVRWTPPTSGWPGLSGSSS